MKITALTVLLGALALPAQAERTHTVVQGDYLWKLAKRYYDNHFRWKAIYAANTKIVKDPHWIYPKQVLMIPDLPESAVGEVGARPIESSAEVPLDLDPVESPPAVSTSAPQEMIAVEGEKPSLGGGNYDLSAEMPPGLAGGFPSLTRYKLPRDWSEDGTITGFVDAEGMAAQGDRIVARMSGDHPPGTELTIYRRDAREELDEDKHATYLLKLGRARVEGGSRGSTRLVILMSGDSVQSGDLLKKEGR